MKIKLLLVFIYILMVGGCATSIYRPAEKYLEKREYNRAIRAYLRILEPHLKGGKRLIYYDKEAVTGIGIVYWHLQRYNTAAKIFRMVLSKDPSFGKARFYLGLSLEGLGNEDEAIEVYQDYINVAENNNYRYVLKGRLDYLTKQKIIKEIQIALKNEAMLSSDDFPEKSVAVLYFMSLSNDPQWEPLQKGLAEMVITDLSQIEELKVVERLRLNNLMEELQLNTSDLMDENTTPRLGKLLGARTLIKGSYMVMSDLKMTMDAGIFQPDMIYQPTTVDFEGSLSRLFQMEKELVLRIVDYLGIELSPQRREQILEIPTKDMMAFMSYCRGLDAMDRVDFEEAQQHFKQAIKLDKNFRMAKDRLISPKLWEATQNRNLYRVKYEVAKWVKKRPIWKPRIEYRPPPDMVSALNRLKLMGVHQKAGFLPSRYSRKSFQEARLKNAPVIPDLLPEPPLPPIMK